MKEATATPKSSPKKTKSTKSFRDSKEMITASIKSSPATSNNENVKSISDSKKSQSIGLKETTGASVSSTMKSSSASSSSKDSKVKKAGGQDSKKQPEVASSSGGDISLKHVQIHSKTGEVKQNPQSVASSIEHSSTKEPSKERKEKTKVSLHDENKKTVVVRRNEQSDVAKSVTASDNKETSNFIPSEKGRARDSNIIESTRI